MTRLLEIAAKVASIPKSDHYWLVFPLDGSWVVAYSRFDNPKKKGYQIFKTDDSKDAVIAFARAVIARALITSRSYKIEPILVYESSSEGHSSRAEIA